MTGLVHASEVGHLVLSEVSDQALRDAISVHPIATLQSEWSLAN